MRLVKYTKLVVDGDRRMFIFAYLTKFGKLSDIDIERQQELTQVLDKILRKVNCSVVRTEYDQERPYVIILINP